MSGLAVLVVDVQQAFREAPYEAFDVAGVVTRINDVTAAARAADIPVLFVQHESASGPFARGAATWKFADGLRIESDDQVVAKKASDAFHETGVSEMLREQGVTELVVCGIQSDYCVDSTVRRALALGFDVRLVEDAMTTLDNGVLAAAQITAHHVKTLTSIQSYPGKAVVRHSRDALSR